MERETDVSLPQVQSRVAVIGCGLVGSSYAYTLLVQGIASEICLIDANKDKAIGEAMDLNHAMPFARRTEIWAGDMEDLVGASVVVIAAGAAQKPGESRMDLLYRNTDIVGSIAREAGRLAPGAVYIIVTNPVDVMAHVAMVRSGVHPSRVIGSGTALDTARLRSLLGRRLSLDPRSIHAFVIGEHGDSEMVAWSTANVAGVSLEKWSRLDQEAKDRIFSEVRNAAYEIIARKGATYYAIALALARITEAILRDQRTVFSVSTYLQGEYGLHDVYLGIPCVVGKEGVLQTIELPLSPQEKERLHYSAKVVKDATRRALTATEWRSDAMAAAAQEAGDLEVDQSSRGSRRTVMRRPRPL